MGTFFSIISLILTLVLSIVADGNYSSVQPLLALLGQSISLECRLDPYVSYMTWQQGSHAILTHRNFQENTIRTEYNTKWHSEIDLTQLRSTLIIKHVKYNDSGRYSCLQYFEGILTRVSTYDLEVQGFPYLSIASNISKENKTMVVFCCVESSANITEKALSWYLGNNPITETSTAKKEELKNGLIKYCTDDLHIFTSRYIHGNNLTCLTRDKFNLSASMVVNVQYPATVRMRTKTSITIFNKDCGSVISCESDGNPRSEVKLQKKSSDGQWKTLPNKPNIQPNVGEKVTFVFHLNDTCRKITGRYRCLASNRIGTTLFTDSVEVVYEFPKMNYSAVLLILVLTLVIAFVLKKVFRKRRPSRYDFFMETTRRHTQRLTDNFRTLTRSLRRTDSTSIPGSYQGSTTPDAQPAQEYEIGGKLTYAKSISRQKERTSPLNVEDNIIESDPKYTSLK